MIDKEAQVPVEGEAPVAPVPAAQVSPMAKIKNLLSEAMTLMAELEGEEADEEGVSADGAEMMDLGGKMAGEEMPMPKKGMKV